MPKFILIDHSLKDVGGHHYDYSVWMLTAAEMVGYEVALASNRRLRCRNTLPQHWSTYPLFPHSTYNKYAVHTSSRGRTVRHSQKNPALVTQAAASESKETSRNTGASWWRSFCRRRVINAFTGACRKLFQKIDLQDGDQIFFTTLSELDLEGLVNYLQTDLTSQRADWHLQFHFNIFDGREPDYAQQTQRHESVRQQFQDALDRLPEHRLHLYNTSQQLNVQYNRLGVAKFENLTYPINDDFYTPQQERESSLPLRVTCGGAIRAEKGHQFFASLVEDLWPDYLSTGKIQLHVQSNRSWFRLPLPDGKPQKKQRPQLPDTTSKDPLVYIKHPLEVDDYVQHIRRADIGLMLYDSLRYYVRRAGILGEYLAAGVPVIVPAGCWLSEQIAEPIFQHLEQLDESVPVIAKLQATDATWHDNTSQITFGDSSAAATCTISPPGNATDLRVNFDWIQPTEPGTYVRLRCAQYDQSDNLLDQFETIVGHREDNRRVAALLHLQHDASRLEITWENAYHDAPVLVDSVEFTFFDASKMPGGNCPAGAVGLTFTTPEQIPALLRDMVDHHAHYLHTAGEYSHDWMRRHDACGTVAQLLSNADRTSTFPEQDAA